MSSVRPIDRGAIAAAAEVGPILTVEEHTVVGGLGSAVAEVVVSCCPVRMHMLGIPGEFAPTGSAAFLFEHYGLTPEHIRRAAKGLLKEGICGTLKTHPDN
jgi:transketolase